MVAGDIDGSNSQSVLADGSEGAAGQARAAPGAPFGRWRGVGYRIGSRWLASEFAQMVEVLPVVQITPVPGAQPWLRGVANVRGEVLPVVDLKLFLQGERSVAHESQRMLRLQQPGADVVVVIDALHGQCSFVQDQRIALAAAKAAPGELLATGRFEAFVDRTYRVDDQDWGIFRLDCLLRAPEFRQASA